MDEYGNMRIKLRPLKYEHFMKMFREAHAEAFTEERNMKDWQKEGILPKFNRMEYWNLLHEVSESKQSLGSNQGPCLYQHGGPFAIYTAIKQRCHCYRKYTAVRHFYESYLKG